MLEELTIEQSRNGCGLGWNVYTWGTYPDSSVLAGQTKTQFVDSFNTLEEAQEKYPEAEVGYRDAHNYFDHLPDTPDY